MSLRAQWGHSLSRRAAPVSPLIPHPHGLLGLPRDCRPLATMPASLLCLTLDSVGRSPRADVSSQAATVDPQSDRETRAQVPQKPLLLRSQATEQFQHNDVGSTRQTLSVTRGWSKEETKRQPPAGGPRAAPTGHLC